VSEDEKLAEQTEREIVEVAEVEGSDRMADDENVEPVIDTAVSEEEIAKEQEPPTIEEQLAAALAEVEDYKDKWMRSQAEFANARKRLEKQRIDLYAMATADVMQKLLPILDDYERAMENVPEAIQGDSWLEGIELVQRKLASVLEAFNVTQIEAIGQPFDPNVHEAISQEETEEYESGTVCRELQSGYKIGDRIIRPSLVVVAQ
jgi:molecular chaperone GrpE